MSQCVPSWDLDENSALPRFDLRAHSNSNSLAPHPPMLDYEVAELTWENGQLSMHGLCPPRVSTKQTPTWEKPRAGGTLESIVNQATSGLPHCIPAMCGGGGGSGPTGENLVPWFNHHRHSVGAAPSTTVSMDAMVPCSNGKARDQQSSHVLDGVQTCVVGSCSGNDAVNNNRNDMGSKRARTPRVPVAPLQPEWSSMDNSFSGSATFGRDSRQLTLDTCERELGVCGGFTSTSTGSPENTSSGQEGTKATTADEHDSVCHRKCKREKGNEEGKKKTGGKSSVTTRRSRAAAIHNQSERKRRDKINQRIKTLQKLVPNSTKTDKASMLDEVIEYVKQLQAQVNVMNRMNMSSMMLPLTLQQQLQLSMMAATAPMGMGGMGMGMGVGLGGLMDLNSIGRHNLGGISSMLHPAAFMPLTSWDNSGDRLSGPTAAVPDPMSAFLACQSQPMTMDAYSRMAALYQQLNQFPPPASKK